MIHFSFFESIIGKSKQKYKSTSETQIPEKSRADRKRYKQDVVHGIVMTSLESKTRGDVYGNVENLVMMTLLLAHG